MNVFTPHYTTLKTMVGFAPHYTTLKTMVGFALHYTTLRNQNIFLLVHSTDTSADDLYNSKRINVKTKVFSRDCANVKAMC